MSEFLVTVEVRDSNSRIKTINEIVEAASSAEAAQNVQAVYQRFWGYDKGRISVTPKIRVHEVEWGGGTSSE